MTSTERATILLATLAKALPQVAQTLPIRNGAYPTPFPVRVCVQRHDEWGGTHVNRY